MIVVIGVAGVGKSTQCRLLQETGKHQWLSVGQYLRDTVEDPTKKAAMLAGNILDDTYVLPLLGKKLEELGDNPELIIDGFPRTIAQADWLIGLHNSSKVHVSHIIHLTADEDVARERLEDRGRSDDTEAAIAERFHDYRENILPIIHHFAKANLKVVDVNGQNTIEEVQRDIRGAIWSTDV